MKRSRRTIAVERVAVASPGRRLVRTAIAALAAAAMLAAAGCDPVPAGDPESGDAAVVNLFAWSEYVPRPVLDGFTAETGIRVNYETFASNEEMLAKLVSGAARYDVIQPSDYTVEALRKEGWLLPVDWSKVPNIRHVAPEFLGLPHDPEQKYSVPYMAGSVGIVVNTGKVREPVHGYADVFQPKYAGRIVVVDDPREMVTWALAVLGHGPNDVTPATLEEVRPVLRAWLPLVKVFDSDSPKTALLGGEADLGVVWSGEAAVLWNEDRKFRYVLPEEGAHRFLDTLAIPKNAANPDAAMRFLDYVLRPEVGRRISAEFPYTNPNLAARRLLSPEELANPASYPPASDAGARDAMDLPPMESLADIGERAVEIDKLVTDLKAGS